MNMQSWPFFSLANAAERYGPVLAVCFPFISIFFDGYWVYSHQKEYKSNEKHPPSITFNAPIARNLQTFL